MENIPRSITLRSEQLRQIETFDSMCFEAFKSARSDKKTRSKQNERNRNYKRSDKRDEKPKVMCNYCQRLGHTEDECYKKTPFVHDQKPILNPQTRTK